MVVIDRSHPAPCRPLARHGGFYFGGEDLDLGTLAGAIVDALLSNKAVIAASVTFPFSMGT